MTPIEQINALHVRHGIRPVSPVDGRDVVPYPYVLCSIDRIPVYRVRGGWRHDRETIKRLAIAALPEWPR